MLENDQLALQLAAGELPQIFYLGALSGEMDDRYLDAEDEGRDENSAVYFALAFLMSALSVAATATDAIGFSEAAYEAIMALPNPKEDSKSRRSRLPQRPVITFVQDFRMHAKLFAAVGLCLIASLLSGCAGGRDPGKAAADHSAAVSQIASKKNQKGSLLLIRLVDGNLMGDQYCSGHIRLRRIDAGKPDKNTAFEDVYSADRWLLPDEKKPKDMQATFLYRVADASSYARSFRPIAPGRYAITYADCQYGISQFSNGVKIEAGGDHNFLFSYVSPLGGASTITIGAGQIIDAGYIRLMGRPSNPIVLSSEASAAEREVMQEVLPGIYKSITFTKFGQ